MLKYKIILKSDQGKYVTLKDTINGWKLCVEEAQKSEVQDLTLWALTEDNKKPTENNMSFGFVWRNKDTLYSPKAKGGQLKLEEFTGPELPPTLSRNHWFTLINHRRGDYYGLASVAEPEKHLSGNIEVQISAEMIEWIYVKDEQVCATTG